MKNMLTAILFLSVCLVHGLACAEEFQIIVHASNPNAAFSKKDVSKLFLKKIKRWKKSNEAVLPVDQLEDSLVRGEFSQHIHGRKVASIKAYWQKQIFSGRGVPPQEKKSDAEVLQYIEENTGALGYVSLEADITQCNVKIIEIIEE